MNILRIIKNFFLFSSSYLILLLSYNNTTSKQDIYKYIHGKLAIYIEKIENDYLRIT